MDAKIEKRILRRQFLERRRALDPEEVRAKSAAIIQRLHNLPPFACAQSILTYVAAKDNEVDTQPLIASLLEQGKEVLVPIAERNRSIMWSRLDGLDELAVGAFEILEPAHQWRRPVLPPKDAVALVPGIVFTRDGWRIGYGGGYYDRFLAHFTGIAIGLAFSEQMTASIPRENHDVPLHYVVTDKVVYRAAGLT